MHAVSPQRSAPRELSRAKLDALIRRLGDGRRSEPATAPRPPDPPTRRFPLSFAQERLWVLDRMQPGSAAYNVPAAVDLEGLLDAAALERALALLVERHEGLRTRFAEEGGEPVQIVVPAVAVALPIIDLSALPAPRRRDEVERRRRGEARAPFDLAAAPLLRVRLLRLSARRHHLLLTLHHVVADGWSLGVLLGELAEAYEALAAGRTPRLPPLETRYVDYARWQRRRLQGPLLESQTAYWRQQLEGLEPLELPADGRRRAGGGFRSGRQALALSRELGERLEALGRRLDATLYMVLLAAFQVLLRRLSGRTDVAVGTPIAGRQRRDLEGLVGIFLNTLVLRTDLAGDPSFDGLVARVREVALAAYAHQDLPFESLLDELRPGRDGSRTPLFRVFFNMLNLPLGERRLDGLRFAPMETPELDAKFDLTLYVSQHEGPIRFEAVYDADLFSARRIAGLLRQYAGLLAQVAADPGAGIDRLDLRTRAERALLPDPRRRLDATWRGAVHELVAERARRSGDRIAVSDGRGAWTYRELARRSRRLARRLARAGVGRGDRVAIVAERRAALAWTVLGVLEAGAAVVLLDPAYPADYLARIVRRARPRAVVDLAAAVAGELASAFARGDVPEVEAETGAPVGAADGPDAPGRGVEVGPDDVAVVSFTSGSTGVPKGILGRHGPLTHFLPWQCRRFELGPEDRYSMLSGLAHDPLQRDLFTPLATGATLVVPDPEALFTAGYLARWMRRERVSVAHLTPAMAQVLAERPIAGPAGAGDGSVEVPSLRRAFLTGDVLTGHDVSRLNQLAPGALCVNLYGSTETQRAVAYHAVAAGRGRHGTLPLGRGMEGVQLVVVGPGGRPAAVGELGEIWVRSPHLARGYLGDESLTRERFLPSPWGEGDPGDRVYRTGDLGRYLPSGEVVFARRADAQVKVRGFRIEPGEIEACLRGLDGVETAAVAVEGGGGRHEARRLVAYLVPRAGGSPPPAETLRAALRRRLPAHMVPSELVFLERLPLTPNGKLDRAALALRGAERSPEAAAETEPQNGLESTLSALLCELLGVESVDPDGNFFDAGANSLLLVRFHARLQAAVGRQFPAVHVFNHPTVRELARYLSLGEGGEATREPFASADRSASLRTGRDRLRRRFERRQTSG